MRKKIILIIIFFIITIFSFYAVYSKNYYKEFMKIRNLENDLQNFEVTISDSNNDYNRTYNIVTKYLDKYNGNIFFSEIDENKTRNRYINYVYFSEENFGKEIILTSGRFFKNEENQSNYFLSTIESKNIQQIGVISDFNGKNIYEIHTIKSNLGVNTFKKVFTIQVENEELLDELISELEIEEIILQKKAIGISGGYNFNNFNIILMICFIALIFLIFYQVFDSYKKIGVQKLLGYSTFYIFKEKLIQIILLEILVIVPVTLVLIFMNFIIFNSLFWNFMKELLLMDCIIIFFTIISISIPYVYVWNISLSNIIKNKRPVKGIIILNNIMKIIIATMIVVFSNSAIDSLFSIGGTYKDSYEVWEDTKEYFVLPELIFTDDSIETYTIEAMEKERELYLYFNKRGSILADFNEYDPITRRENKKLLSKDYMVDHIIVNPNYLLKHKIYDIEGNIVDISEMEQSTILLIPDKYKEFEKEIRSFYDYNSSEPCSSNRCSHTTADGKIELTKQEQKIIWVKSNQKYFSYLLDVNPKNGNYVSDPIVNVLTESNDKLVNYYKVVGYTNSPFKIKATKEAEIMSKVEEYYDMNIYMINAQNLYENINSKIVNIKADMKIIILIIIILMGIIIMIISQNSSLYFNHKKNKLLMQKINGYKLVDRYRWYFVSLIITWSCILAITSILTRDVKVIYLTLILTIIEIFSTAIIVNSLERKSLVKFTKGGI